MSGHGYESGRLNLPFVGLCSFGKYPYQPDWDSIDADFAILGAPFDFGTQFRAGARFGPRGVREASTLFSFGHAGAYDHEDDVTYLENDKVRIVDIGDADIVHTDTVKSHANIEAGVRAILKTGWGGIGEVEVPETIHVIKGAPFHLLFKHVSAVVHHGGAGTTAAGLRAGLPTLICPLTFDQPFWGRRVHSLGCGPKPQPLKRLRVSRLAEGLIDQIGRAHV